jgi:hypothetical protein
VTKVAQRRLEEALRLLGADPATADALTRADALWLARVLPDGDEPAAETGATTGAAGPRADAPPLPAEGPATGPAPAPDTDAPPPPPADNTKSGTDTTALFVQQTGAEDEPQLHARRVPVPAADALPGRAALERALRPFLRRRPSRVRRMVDAEATAEASAQASADALLAAAPGERATPALVPVLRPVPERWFDMVLLAEQDDTMRVFEDTLKELRQLLARHGAFRRVGLWRWSVVDGTVHVQTASGMPSAPRAMLQGQHPQLIWVLTHGASSKWDGPPLRDFVRSLAAHAVLAVVQLLPESAWGATALGESRERVRSRERAATNRQLLRRDLWTANWTREGALGVVPMLSLRADSVARWAEFVMSPRALEHAAVAVNALTDARDEDELAMRLLAAAGDADDTEARIRERVLSFRAIASPQAFALLRLLSGAWITLPVMRLLLQSMPIPRALAPMAEVLLSGLLQRTSKPDARTEELTFDFAPGVREWLSGSLSGDERRALDKAMADSKEAIRQFVETKLNRTLTSFSALLVDPDGTEFLPASAKSFVEVSRKLRSLRGAPPVSAPVVVKPGPAEQPRPRTVRKLRILHLSDLHIGREKPIGAWRERPFMGEAWRENLRHICAQGAIDLVCLTGDVAHSGKAEEYDQAKHFVFELMSTLQLGMDRFFVVPGNHDIDRSLNPDAWTILNRTSVLRNLDTHDFEQVLQRQRAFRGWMASLGLKQHPKTVGYREKVDLGPDASISIIGIDSAWLADDEKRAVPPRAGESQLARLFTAPFPNGWSIALMHHPLHALGDGKSVEVWLARAGATPLLHGHRHGLHESRWAKTPRGIHVSSTGGLYEDDMLLTGVHILDVELHPPAADIPGRVQPVRMASRVWSASGYWRDAEDISVEGVISIEPNQPTRTTSLKPETLAPEQPIFVGRRHEQEQMLRALRPPRGVRPRPVAVLGAAGIGKTALTRAFLLRHWEPGTGSEAPVDKSYLRFMLGRHASDGHSAATLAQMVTDGLGMSAGPNDIPAAWRWEVLQRELQRQPRLLLFDDVDTEQLTAAVTDFARRLPGWPIIATSRLQMFDRDWVTIELAPLSLQEACELLRAEVASDGTGATLSDAAAEEMASIAGYLPVVLRLAARRWAQSVTPQEVRGEFHEGRTAAPPPATPPAVDPNAFEQALEDEKVKIQQALGLPAETATQGAKTLSVLISAVGSEFGLVSEALRQRLQLRGFDVLTQDESPGAGVPTLIRIDDRIRDCDVVVHLAGDACGADARPAGVKALTGRHPDLASRFPILRKHLSGSGQPLTYQQWEAWLALYHGKQLVIAKPSSAFRRGLARMPDESQMQRQQQHLGMLERDGHAHTEILFNGVDDLELSLLSSDLVADAAPAAPTAPEPAIEPIPNNPPATEPSRVTLDLSEDDLAKLEDLAPSPSSETERIRKELAELHAAQKTPAEPATPSTRNLDIYISAVSSEFEPYRDVLGRALTRPNVGVKVQEDFRAGGMPTLLKLDDYIKACDAVIHLVGDACGPDVSPQALQALSDRYPDLATRVPVLAAHIGPNAQPLTYTQWEAWLAIYHGKRLFFATPNATAPRAPRFVHDEAQFLRQRAHLAALRESHLYPEIQFDNVDHLAMQLLASPILDMLARAAFSQRQERIPLKVFLSYTSVDIAAARELRRKLREDGHAPWLAEEDLLPGQNWQVETTRALREADVVLVCLSTHSLAKPGFAQHEIRLALETSARQPAGSIYLVPVRLEPCEVPKELAQWHWVDYFADDGYRKLLGALEAKRTQPNLPSAAPPTSSTPATGPEGAPQAPTTAPAPRRPTMFLSYARENIKAVRKLVQRLEQLGFECLWFDVFEVLSTDDANQRIDAAMQACTYFMPVLSTTADQRLHGRYWEEWAWAIKRSHKRDGAFLLPVGLDRRPPDHMDYKRVFTGATAELAKGTLLHAREGEFDDKAVAELTRLLALHGIQAPGPVPRIFISYAHDDIAQAQKLYEQLTGSLGKHGAELYFETDWSSTSNDWRPRLETALGQSDVYFLLLSPRYTATDFCLHHEARRALERMRTHGAKVYMVLLSDCDWQRQRPDPHPKAPSLGEIQAAGPFDDSGRLVPMTHVRSDDAAWIEIIQRFGVTLSRHGG